MFNLKPNKMCSDIKPTFPECRETIPLFDSILIDGKGNAYNKFKQKIGTYVLENGMYKITIVNAN